MGFNLDILNEVAGLRVVSKWIRAGVFSHRHPRDVPDPVQCLRRTEYLQEIAAEGGGWALVLDSDELLFGGYDALTVALNLADSEEFSGQVDVIAISEIRPNLDIFLRPRLIKVIPGLKYGGIDKKHDFIAYCDHIEPHDYDSEEDFIKYGACRLARNYIDVSPDNPRMWTLDGVAFWHIKNGLLNIYSPEDLKEQEGGQVYNHIKTDLRLESD